jgi:hypothetical protein
VKAVLGFVACLFLLCGVGRCDGGLAPASIQTLMDRSLAVDTWRSGEDTVTKKPASQQAPGVAATHRSLLKVGLLSALVPGWGQHYNGRPQKARYFFAAEALTWIGFAAFHTYGDWRRDDYIRFAAERANARLEGKDDDFADLIGFYEDIDQYNTLGRAYDPERPFLADTPDNHWRWQTESDRRDYRDIKNRSRESYRRSEFMIGVAVLNRIVSVIDAVRDASRDNRRIDPGFSVDEERSVRLTIDPLSMRRQVCLTFYPSF